MRTLVAVVLFLLVASCTADKSADNVDSDTSTADTTSPEAPVELDIDLLALNFTKVPGAEHVFKQGSTEVILAQEADKLQVSEMRSKAATTEFSQIWCMPAESTITLPQAALREFQLNIDAIAAGDYTKELVRSKVYRIVSAVPPPLECYGQVR